MALLRTRAGRDVLLANERSPLIKEQRVLSEVPYRVDLALRQLGVFEVESAAGMGLQGATNDARRVVAMLDSEERKPRCSSAVSATTSSPVPHLALLAPHTLSTSPRLSNVTKPQFQLKTSQFLSLACTHSTLQLIASIVGLTYSKSTALPKVNETCSIV